MSHATNLVGMDWKRLSIQSQILGYTDGHPITIALYMRTMGCMTSLVASNVQCSVLLTNSGCIHFT